MKKKFILLTIGAGLLFSPLGSKNAVAKASNETPYAANYLRVGSGETNQIWKHVNNMEDGGSPQIQAIATENGYELSEVTKEPIIFFNVNPSWNIVEIHDIYVRVTDTNGNEVDYLTIGDIENNDGIFEWFAYKEFGQELGIEKEVLTKISEDQYSYATYLEGNKGKDYKAREIDRFTYKNGAFLNTKVNIKTYYPDAIQYLLPRIGRTQVIYDWYQSMGEHTKHSASLLDSSLFRYKTTNINEGFTAANDALNSGPIRNPGWYLILPLSKTSHLNIDYLAVEATDVNGKRISPVIDLRQNGDNTYSFDVIKQDGEWETANAAYFPGNNAYYASKFELKSYELVEDIDENKPVVVSLGNLINKDSIEENNLKQNNPLYLNNVKKVRYEFSGDANCLIVLIPEEVKTALVTITFARGIGYNTKIQDPFYINLLDKDGNYGIRGDLPLENDPNAQSFWDKLANGFKSLFDFSQFGFSNPIETITSIFKIILILAITTLLIYLGYKIYRLIKRLVVKSKSNKKEV